MPDIEDSKLYKLTDVSEMIGLPRTTLKKYAQNGGVKAVKIGRDWHMTGEAIKHLLEHGTGTTKDGKE